MDFQFYQLWNRNRRKFVLQCLLGSSLVVFVDSNSVDNVGHPDCLRHHWWFSTNLSACFGDSGYTVDASRHFGQRESISGFGHSTTAFIVELSHELEPSAVPIRLTDRCLVQRSVLTFDHSGLKWFVDAGSRRIPADVWHRFDVLCLVVPSAFSSPLFGHDYCCSCVMLFLENAIASFAGFACTHYWSDWIDSNWLSLLHRYRHPKHALRSLDPHTRNCPGHLEKSISCQQWLNCCCRDCWYSLSTNGLWKLMSLDRFLAEPMLLSYPIVAAAGRRSQLQLAANPAVEKYLDWSGHRHDSNQYCWLPIYGFETQTVRHRSQPSWLDSIVPMAQLHFHIATLIRCFDFAFSFQMRIALDK